MGRSGSPARRDTAKEEAVIDNRMAELEAQALATVDKLKVLSSSTAIKYMEEDLMKTEEQIRALVDSKAQQKKDQPVSF